MAGDQFPTDLFCSSAHSERSHKGTLPAEITNCPTQIQAYALANSFSLREKAFFLLRRFACLPVCLSACLPACLSVCLPACLSICLSVCLSVRLSVSLSQSRYKTYVVNWTQSTNSLCLSVCVCLCLCVSVCVSLSVCLSVYTCLLLAM